MGRRTVSKEEWVNSLFKDGDVKGPGIPHTEWVDPRKGELFDLIETILK